MRRLIFMVAVALAALSCHRRELTYDYSPYCEVLVNVDWSNMSKAPTGMSIYAYPQDGGTPVVIRSNDINSGVLKLPAGVYNILVFNQIPTDFGGVGFRGLDKWESAEVYSNEIAKTSWALSKSGATIVREPEVIAAATYTDVEVCEESVNKSTDLFELTGERMVIDTLDLKPKIVVKRTMVRVTVDGIYNLRSTRGVLTGMTDGYNFAKQQSCSSKVSHVLEDWKIESFNYGDRFGETNVYFMSFGLPETTTETRAAVQWNGSLYLQLLLVDNKTVIEHTADITNRTSTKQSDGAAGDTNVDADVDVETSITVEVGFSLDPDDKRPVLPDVKPEGGADSGFDATIDDWEHEESHNVDI